MSIATIERKINNSLHRAITFNGVCFRVVSQRYATQHNACSTQGSVIAGGRFNFKNTFGVLYLSLDPHTCLDEKTHAAAQISLDAVAKLLPVTTISIEVKISRVLDLTDSHLRKTLGISKKILTDTDWEHIQEVLQREAITQSIGRFARDANFEAILVPSGVSRGKNLDIFPDRLLSTSFLTLVNPAELP
jgi:RES domain-containing protein